MSAELVGATGVAGRATTQVRRALANREVEALDERGVQGCGILRRFTGTTTVLPTDIGISLMRVGGTSALVGKEVRVDFDIVLEAP